MAVTSNEQIKQVAQMDWEQVRLNGGPPCFALLEDEPGWYCGRAKQWEGHDGEHEFVSLEQLLAAKSQPQPSVGVKEAVQRAAEKLSPHIDAYFRLNRDWKDQVAALIESEFQLVALPDGVEGDDWVAWIRYVYHGQYEDSGADIITIEVCSSDDKGAFKVYPESAIAAAFARGEVAGIEKAIKVCDSYRTETYPVDVCDTAKEITREIRALTGEEVNQDQD